MSKSITIDEIIKRTEALVLDLKALKKEQAEEVVEAYYRGTLEQGGHQRDIFYISSAYRKMKDKS